MPPQAACRLDPLLARVPRLEEGCDSDLTENSAFATGDSGRIEKLKTRFSICIDPESKEGTLGDALGTALIAPDGRLATVWWGNRWTVDEVTEAISTILEIKT